MSIDIKELFGILSERKKEKMHDDELQTLSVRLTPEIGIMLKTLSMDNILNFPISTTFREVMSNELHDIIIEKTSSEENLSSLNELINSINDRNDIVENANINNAFNLIKSSKYLEYRKNELDLSGFFANDRDEDGNMKKEG
ncbi:hypothetical protein [Vibrio rarus]|uniref:hypothetical protein n=1 Tax=Vibrio rarus TaxID=413403 RepID=UPI0021C47BD1|nr:hypothetical protein [Vibrio rarus]